MTAKGDPVLAFMDDQDFPILLCERGTGRLLAHNRVAAELLGLPAEVRPGTTLLDLLDEPDLVRWRELCSLHSSEPPCLQGVRVRTASGKVQSVTMLWRPVQFRGGEVLEVEIHTAAPSPAAREDTSRLLSLFRLLKDLQALRAGSPTVDAWLEQLAIGLAELDQVHWSVVAQVRPDGNPAGKVHVAGTGLSEDHRRALLCGPWPACFRRALTSHQLQKRRASETCQDCCLAKVCARFDTVHVRLEWKGRIWGVLGLGVRPQALADKALLTVLEDLTQGVALGVGIAGTGT